ncbi:MAG: amidohydrolase family protein [Anaerolineae bacterium]
MHDLPPIIDIHTHIGHLPGIIGEVFTPEDLGYILDHEGARMMLASSASTTTMSQQYGTAETIAMVEGYDARLKGMLWINPHDPDWLAIVSRIDPQQFVGIKIHPVLDHYAVSIAALEPVFSFARQQHWPILTHTDVDGTPMSALRYESLIKAFPDVVLILAHLRLEAIPLALRYANVFVDTTYVDPLMVEVGLAALGPDKVLFGSDAAEGFEVGHPVVLERPRRSYAALVASLRQRGISEGALSKILYENALSLFRLEV